MKRAKFLKKISGIGLIPLVGLKAYDKVDTKPADQLRKELNAAWQRSEKMTLTSMEQMPPECYRFKYTNEAMTFSEQWRHCVIYTCGQLASRTGITNPYKHVKLPVQMPKEEVIGEIKKMYAFVRQTIEELSSEKLFSNCDFAGDVIPVWRLLYALENHIIHHRGQCVVYLRLNGQVPKGYYGW
ncbi:DinB family protein [Fulvivirgaceae bacterium BMA12]|uniref:DinB family protein n=1 Tax=Agaribacillus aureus TaxID=3051825 RepID=A0ABT8L7N7_9BACT|nr:DinB family protein [Fulvivirgaceae bacterium BMA12]